MPKQKAKLFFEKMVFLVKHLFDRQHEPLLHTIEWVFILLAFFVIGFSMVYYQKTIEVYEKLSGKFIGSREDFLQALEEEKMLTGKVAPEPIDTSDWKTYQDNKYNFEIKYPPSWADPKPQVINDKDFAYQYKVSFGTTETLSENDNDGFSVYVTKRDSSDENIDLGDCISSPPETQQITSPSKDSGQTDLKDQCLLYKVRLAGEDPGYYSYQFMGQNFEYNFFPALIDSSKSSSLVTENMPQFEAAANTFTLDFEAIELAKKKTAERLKQQAIAAEKARIKSLYRPSTQKSVCIEKHIHPSKSDKQGKHVDEDCCPDPDEWPNLRCKYKPSDYGILLKGSPPSKLLGKD